MCQLCLKSKVALFNDKCKYNMLNYINCRRYYAFMQIITAINWRRYYYTTQWNWRKFSCLFKMKTFKTLKMQSNITFNAEKFGSAFTFIFGAVSLRSFPNPMVIFFGHSHMNFGCRFCVKLSSAVKLISVVNATSMQNRNKGHHHFLLCKLIMYTARF